MRKPLQYIAPAAAIVLTVGFADRGASAQISLGVGVPEVEVNIGTRTEIRTTGPYVYDGYESGHWHTRGDIHSSYYWDARYEGYDCY